MAKKVVKKTTKKSPKKQVKLNLGCGLNLVDGFINVDGAFSYEQLYHDVTTKTGPFRDAHIEKGAKFVQADCRQLPFKDNFADYIETSDMIEHLPYRDVPIAIREMYRVLKPGGEIRIETVNFDEIARLWVTHVSNYAGKLDLVDSNSPFYDLQEVIYGIQTDEGQFHRAAMNPQLLDMIMRMVGFKDIHAEVYPTGCATQPDMQANPKWEKGAVIRVEEFIMKATKY
jgi:SAM-dependent methyltransferase